LLAEYATVVHTASEVCQLINNPLRRILPVGTFFTAAYARLNRATKKLTLVNAGHPPAILHHVKRGRADVLVQDGDVIGAFADASFGVLEVAVSPGDRLFLHTDGLVERNGDREPGIAALREACLAAASLPLREAVSSIVSGVCDTSVLQDDIVLLGIEV
jgi:phosphoserine phosphatase RsbU/P